MRWDRQPRSPCGLFHVRVSAPDLGSAVSAPSQRVFASRKRKRVSRIISFIILDRDHTTRVASAVKLHNRELGLIGPNVMMNIVSAPRSTTSSTSFHHCTPKNDLTRTDTLCGHSTRRSPCPSCRLVRLPESRSLAWKGKIRDTPIGTTQLCRRGGCSLKRCRSRH
jgi:hypothetical protein